MPVDNNNRLPPKVGAGDVTSTGRGTRPTGPAGPTAPAAQPAVAPELPPPEPDNFHGQHQPARTVTTGVFVRGEGMPIAKAVETLLPDLKRFRDAPEVVARYSADFAVLAEHLVGTPGLTRRQKAERLYAFFVAYAERFVQVVQRQQPGTKAGHDARQGQEQGAGLREHPEVKNFLSALADTGFGELVEHRTGKSGVEVARELLLSKTVREFEQQAQQRVLVPARGETAAPAQAPNPSDVLRPGTPEQFVHHPENAARGAEQQIAQSAHFDQREAANVGDRFRVNAWGPESARVIVQPKLQHDGATHSADDGGAHRLGTTNKRLGRNLFWNVLHRFRDDPDDSALEQERWDRMTFGAVLVLVGVGLLVIVLVNL